jgi:cupin fold WbuC family metalloprotein
MPSHRRALDAPTGDLAILSRGVVATSVAYSRESPRRRVIQPFHRSAADPLHRMLNAVQPDSYVRPHRHLDPPKAEAWIVLQGALVFFTFEDDGAVRDSVRLSASGENFGVDLAPGIYHGFVALEPDTVIYEVKTGPYSEQDDKSFAPWAPLEGQPQAAAYMQTLLALYERRQG